MNGQNTVKHDVNTTFSQTVSFFVRFMTDVVVTHLCPHVLTDQEKIVQQSEFEQYVKLQNISKELSVHIERHTRAHSLHPLWRNLHILRITSYTFGDILPPFLTTNDRE